VRSVSVSRRVSAIVALLAFVALLGVAVVALLRHPLPLLAAVVLLSVGIGAAAYALTRTGVRRAVAAVLAVAALAAPLVLVVAYGRVLWLVLLIGLVVMAGGATRYALGRGIAALKSGPTPGVAVGPATRPVLLMNPKSGGGKVERFNLVEEARRRGIEPVVLAPGDDLLQLARQAVAGGADVVGMAGGDGSQALVASVASAHDVGFVCVPAGTRNHLAMDLGLDRDDVVGMAGGDGSQALVAGVAATHDVGFVCVPAGTRNHLAMDLGLDRDDVVGALEAFGAAVERRMDLGMIGDRVFVNNATAGLYAKIVQSPAYRDRKVGTALAMLPEMLGPHAAPFDLQFTGPDGTDHASAHLILVSNDRYDLNRGDGFGSRRRLDTGTLGIVAATFGSSRDIARLVEIHSAGGRTRRPDGWIEWDDTSFEVRSDQPVEIGLDGEAMVLDPPIRFRTAPAALRVRIPAHAPGYSPAAAAPTPGWATVTALLQTAAGRPVTIEP
jgi:diacylglycerol kinase family enzyme